MSPAIEVTSEYDDNIYLLPASRTSDLDSPSAGAVASGRYADMSSAGDVITTITGAALLRGSGLRGRRLDIQPELAYAANARNAQRRSVAVGLELTQDLPHGSRVRVAAHTTPSYFAKNYLVDATDLNADGSISSGERRYAAGTYREGDVSLDYRYRLNRSTKESPFGAALQMGGGYYTRSYQEPLSGRDLKGPTADARLLLEITRRLGMNVGYGYGAMSATPTEQVMVVDESKVGRDLNGNSSTTDANVRVVGLADRSRAEHSAGVGAKLELTRRTDLRVDAERRIRRFSSNEPLDFANTGRRDVRDQVGAELTIALRPGMRLSMRGERSSQRLERGQDAGVGEIDDYARTRVALGVRFGF